MDQINNQIQDNIQEVRAKTATYIGTAFGLVAGLAWNDAIKALIESVFPLTRNTVAVKFLYAILVTVVVVVLIRYIDRIFNKKTDQLG